ncbi:MAG: hypothetical protein JWM39_192 [Parcubacteria group bacterium]|jgi:hypothetical protein|nr:hypothetical protein [Parcubacteria group bacterium]
MTTYSFETITTAQALALGLPGNDVMVFADTRVEGSNLKIQDFTGGGNDIISCTKPDQYPSERPGRHQKMPQGGKGSFKHQTHKRVRWR